MPSQRPASFLQLSAAGSSRPLPPYLTLGVSCGGTAVLSAPTPPPPLPSPEHQVLCRNTAPLLAHEPPAPNNKVKTCGFAAS